MTLQLPQIFLDKMKHLLGAEFEDFLQSYEKARYYGLRANLLKVSAKEWEKLNPFVADGQSHPIPWAEGAYYYYEEQRPGKHPYYHAGLYYIQEPSAMVPAELLDVQPGDRVLDLCAAPGGKSTQLASKLQGQGVLVSNDNARERTKVLAKNIELAGIRNAVVLNEEPHRLAGKFRGWFNRILVDAPCSGEGMFRKDESMIAEWEKHSVERCSLMQREIMQHAVAMLAPGGTLVYSTCTFSPEENECQIAELLQQYPELEVVPIEAEFGWAQGQPRFVEEYGTGAAQSKGTGESREKTKNGNKPALAEGEQQDGTRPVLTEERLQSLAGTVRLWPHRIAGEGHYAAVLRKCGGTEAEGFLAAGSASAASLSAESAKLDEIEKQKKHGKPTKQDKQGRQKDPSINISARGKQRGGDYDGDRYGQRKTANKAGPQTFSKSGVQTDTDAIAAWIAFAAENLTKGYELVGKPIAFGSRVYLQPEGLPSLDGLKVVRAGWYVGEVGNGSRFQPSQPLAMGLRRDEARMQLSYGVDEAEVLRFLSGETLHAGEEKVVLSLGSAVKSDKQQNDVSKSDTKKGYVLVCVDGYPLGWGKYADGMLKNGLPAGWRRM